MHAAGASRGGARANFRRVGAGIPNVRIGCAGHRRDSRIKTRAAAGLIPKSNPAGRWDRQTNLVSVIRLAILLHMRVRGCGEFCRDRVRAGARIA